MTSGYETDQVYSNKKNTVPGANTGPNTFEIIHHHLYYELQMNNILNARVR